MTLSFINLPDIEFTEQDGQTILNEMIIYFESMTGRALSKADPERIVLNIFAKMIILQRVLIDQTAKSQLLPYATGLMLDYLGAFNNTPRLPPSSALTILRFVLSVALVEARTIPAGTRVGPTSSDVSIYFATIAPYTFKPGEVVGDVPAIALTPGVIGNGFIPAQITELIDPLPYIEAVVNTTESKGGVDEESDTSYRERIHLSNATYSTAGPEDAYVYWAKTASPAIVDVAVVSPTPMHITIVPLLANGEIPTQPVLDAVAAVVNSRTIRPLGDRVTVSAPAEVGYEINFTYYIQSDKITEVELIKERVAKAVADYRVWQKSKLGRPVNPSELHFLVKTAGAYRVNIISPIDKAVPKLQVAKDTSVTVTYGGIVDD